MRKMGFIRSRIRLIRYGKFWKVTLMLAEQKLVNYLHGNEKRCLNCQRCSIMFNEKSCWFCCQKINSMFVEIGPIREGASGCHDFVNNIVKDGK